MDTTVITVTVISILYCLVGYFVALRVERTIIKAQGEPNSIAFLAVLIFWLPALLIIIISDKDK